MLYIGSHVSMSGKTMFEGSVQTTLDNGANALMIYTGAPQNTKRRPLEQMKIEEAKILMEENNIPFENVIVHAPYIMNLANMDPEKRQFAVDFLTTEIKRTAAIGAKQIVLHPGAHVKQGPKVGIEQIINGLNQVIENTKDVEDSELIEGYVQGVNCINERYISKAVCSNAAKLADEIGAAAITTLTNSGYTAFQISARRPKSNILAFQIGP